jgi:hypothetical protein
MKISKSAIERLRRVTNLVGNLLPFMCPMIRATFPKLLNYTERLLGLIG